MANSVAHHKMTVHFFWDCSLRQMVNLCDHPKGVSWTGLLGLGDHSGMAGSLV